MTFSSGDSFEEMVKNTDFYVDKSMLIADIIDGEEVMIIVKPRRSGKSTNLQMMRMFFEIKKNKDEERAARMLFEGGTF